MTFDEQKEIFYAEREKEDGCKIMAKVTAIINEIGKRFLNMNGDELADMQTKLIGYKFYLADYSTEMDRLSEGLKLELKEQKATRWDKIKDEILASGEKVRNKEQIENIIMLQTIEISQEQILYETFFNKYKLKLSAVNDMITAIVQRLAELKRQIEQSKI